MALKVAKRGTIPPFIVMDVMREANEREAQGEDVLHLEVGQPCTGAPGPVLEAAKAAGGGLLEGVISGRALYDGRIDLAAAVGLLAA